MARVEAIEILRELMDAYDSNRNLWVREHGDCTGFDSWFTSQVLCSAKDASNVEVIGFRLDTV